MQKKNFLKLMCFVLSLSFMYIVFKKITKNNVNPLEINFIGTSNGGVGMEEYVKGPIQENDKRITSFILSHGFVHSPPSPNTPYNLTIPKNIDPSQGQSQVVQKIFKNMKNGFFFECGALDGETRSNTLALERNHNWTGLLIEGSPSNFELVKTKKRKAWTANCCLAIHPFPHEVLFRQNFNIEKISSDGENKIQLNETANEVNSLVPVQCFPIFSLLSAVIVTTVDYFSLDVEGSELEVLKTIPFDSVYIKVLSVEFIHVGGGEGEDLLKRFMESKNYSVVTKVVAGHNWANDFIFVHKDFNMSEKFP